MMDEILKQEIKNGIRLQNLFLKKFQNDNITAFIKLHEYAHKGDVLYLLSRGYVYGVIRIGNVRKIDKAELDKTYDKHKTTSFYTHIWWQNKEPYYLYEFTKLRQFNIPAHYT